MDFQVINSLFLFIWQLLYSTPLLLKKNFTGYIILIWCVFVLFFSILEMSSGLCHFRYEVNHFSCHCLPVCNLYSFPLADFATCCLFLVFSNLIMMCVGMVFVCFYSLCLEFFEVLRSGSCFFFFFLITLEKIWQLFLQIHFSSLFLLSSSSGSSTIRTLNCLILSQGLLVLCPFIFLIL